VLLVAAVCAPTAIAKPGSGPRETIDQGYTATRANSPTGASFTGVYHAAGDPKGNPPYMRRMVFYPPRGFRYDTSVPDRCTATDVELEVRGPAACPSGSRVGAGTTEGLFFEPIAHAFVFSHYNNPFDVVNNANEQVMLIQTPGGFTVVRGRIRPDQSVEYSSPTCFPAPPAGQQCPDDYVLQVKSSSSMPPHTKISGGRVRTYMRTPPKCPARGFWRTNVKFWWADGSVDTVATRQPCGRPRG
jgi:hypothetical protein